MRHEFVCDVCKEKITHESTLTTGYARDKDNNKICFDCCGKRDLQDLLNMETGKDKICLYLTKEYTNEEKGIYQYFITNWPGTFKKQCYVKEGRHNIARKRYDAYFTLTNNDGTKQYYHGITYGDNTEICHIKRIKHF